MQLDDRNKLNRIEELKNKLFSKSYKTKIEHRDGYSRLNINEDFDSWKENEHIKIDSGEFFFMKTSLFKKFFIFSVIFFIKFLSHSVINYYYSFTIFSFNYSIC